MKYTVFLIVVPERERERRIGEREKKKEGEERGIRRGLRQCLHSSGTCKELRESGIWTFQMNDTYLHVVSSYPLHRQLLFAPLH